MRAHRGKRNDTTSREPLPSPFIRLAEGEYHARIATSPGVALVLFTAPHCGACRAWKRLLPAALAGQVATFYEVDASEATGVARYFGVFHLPTIYLYRDGQFHAELQCAARPEEIRLAVARALRAPAQDEPD